MTIEIKCPICSSVGFDDEIIVKDYEHGVPGEWTLLCCSNCKAYYQNPMPSEKDLGAFYPKTYSAYNSNTIISLLFKMVYFLEARRIKKLIPNCAKILDVGCGNGNSLESLRGSNSKWILCGVEIDPHAASLANKRGFKVFNGQLIESDFEENSFDLIKMGHFIEHVPDPQSTLEKAYKLLKPGGILVGETPNIDCIDFHLFKKYWGALHIPRHLILFNQNNLVALLTNVGYSDVKLSAGLRTVGWSASIQNWLADKKFVKVPASGRVSWYILLIIPFLPITALQAITKRPGSMGFRAYKHR